MLDFQKILQYLAVLTLFGLIFNAILESEPEFEFAQREVAKQTGAFLSFLGYNAGHYDYVVFASYGANFEEIEKTLSVYGFQKSIYSGGVEFKVERIHPDWLKIVKEYVQTLRNKGEPVIGSDHVFYIQGKNLVEIQVIPNCVGWIGIFSICALIIGYPGFNFRKKLNGLLVCIPIIYAVNILRLSVIAIAGAEYGFNVMDFVHTFLWKFLLLFVTILLWYLWIKTDGFEIKEKNKKKRIVKK
ncbi:MAG: exosortase/archaeosortase family protein [archaeon]